MKLIFSTLLLLCTNAAFSQQNTDYLKKSKNQKKVALIMLGGGASLFLTGIVIPKGELIHESILQKNYENDGIKSDFKLTGILSMLGSIPLFIASSKNKKKAMSVSFKNTPLQQIQRGSFVSRSQPSLSLKIEL